MSTLSSLFPILLIELHRKEKLEKKRDPSISDEEEEKVNCSVKPEEVPEVPANRFLLRADPVPPQEEGEGDNRLRHTDRPYRDRVFGRRVKGRGVLRYVRQRSRSNTPPHWKREQERIRPFKEKKDRRSRSRDRSRSKNRRRDSESPDLWRRNPRRRSRSSSPSDVYRRRNHRRHRSRSIEKTHDKTSSRKCDRRDSDVESDFEQQRHEAKSQSFSSTEVKEKE